MRPLTGNSGRGAGLGIALVCVAQFVVVLDVTIVTTSLPVVRQSLGFSAAGLTWVITAYTLVFGGFLIPGGRLADLVGARRVFVLGFVLFSVASGACALAGSPAMLVGARAVQGLGAAMLSPAAFALLAQLTAPGPARRRAVGWWTAAAATGGASGWVLGGVLTQYLGWQSVFWVNLPIGLATAILAVRLPTGQRTRGRRLDLPGSVGVVVALALLLLGLTSIGERGPTAVESWGPLLLAAVAVVLVVRRERTTADPLVPGAVVSSRPVLGAILTAFAITATTTPAMYLSTLYVQQVLHYPPVRASLLFPIVNLGVVGGSLLGPSALRRWGGRRTLVVGFATIGVGIVPLLTLGPDRAVPQLVLAFTLVGAGLGAASVASTQTGTEAAGADQKGVAAGILSAAAQVGNAFGLALTPLAIGADGEIAFGVGFVGTAVLAIVGLFLGLLVPTRTTPAADRHALSRSAGSR